ncbi:MAG: hypothetical protein JW863_13140 [Chitinispirillaceae bacterium]|nr:hypothetical protein [Chitinispirillaceae bacterium]
MVATAAKAASLLRKHGISPTVVNARFAKPIDSEAFVDLYRAHDCIFTMESNTIVGGFGATVAEALCSYGLIR